MNEELKQEVISLIQEQLSSNQLSSLVCPFHNHTKTDVGQLDASKSLINTPQSKLTIASGGNLSSGGATGLTNADSVILTNAILRLANIETALTNIGLIKS